MPILLSPRSKFPVVLESDKHLPPDKQPRFIFRALSCNEYECLATDTADAHLATIGEAASMRLLVEVLGRHLVGWENMTDSDANLMPFDPNKLGDFLTLFEAWELVNKMKRVGSPDYDDKKKSDSQPA